MIEIENMIDERQQKLRQIADHYQEKQLWKLAEECGELVQALSKYVLTGDKCPVIEEIADVKNVAPQVEYLLGIEDDVEPMMEYKLDRTIKEIEKAAKESLRKAELGNNRYEELEKQGRLMVLPVAVGSIVYEIIEESVPHHYFYINSYTVEDVSAKAVMYAGDWTDLSYPNLYFSLADAEEALWKMRVAEVREKTRLPGADAADVFEQEIGRTDMQEGVGCGSCVSKERCEEILTKEIQDLLPPEKWEDYERSVNRVLYEFKKLDGAKPKYHKGKHIKD